MSGFSDLAAGVDDACREHLTDPALWRAGGAGDGVAVGVMLEEPDVEVALGRGRVLQDRILLSVFKVDVAAPARNDTCEISEGANADRLFRVIAEPRLDADGTLWLCEVAEVTA